MPRTSGICALTFAVLCGAFAGTAGATPISVYGAWHCGNDFCTWATVRSLSEFDQKNHWIIDRGDGRPAVNRVILSFVHPLRLLNKTTDAQTLDGVPRGMTAEIVNYFKSRNIRVMLSIGGITYTDAWNEALAAGGAQLGLNAAEVATRLGVGIEIDPDLVLKARDNAFREKVEHLVEFRAQDAFAADVSPATVVTLYMLPEFNAKLRPILERQLKPGSRVVSHDYPIEGWVPDRVERVTGDWLHDHAVLLFEIR